MVWLKANENMKSVYNRLIESMKVDVKWKGEFLIVDNRLILPGEINSLIFDFGVRKAYASIIDIPPVPRDIFEIADRKLLINMFNMVLYIFGKWKAISGIKVEQPYMKLDMLLKNILQEIDVKSYFNENGLKFATNNGIQIIFEEVVSTAVESIKKKELDEKTMSESEDIHEGLWHDMKWKLLPAQFLKNDITDDMAESDRIGNNFYMSKYTCPECKENMHMTVYPEKKEFMIESEKGKVFMARVFACPLCNAFYTPATQKLLSEGETFKLDFEDDKKAANDYRRLIGKNGGRNANCNYNMYEADYLEKRFGVFGESLPKLCRHLEELTDEEIRLILARIEESFYPKVDVDRFLAVIERELEYRKNHPRIADELKKLDDEDEEKQAGVFGKLLSERNKENQGIKPAASGTVSSVKLSEAGVSEEDDGMADKLRSIMSHIEEKEPDEDTGLEYAEVISEKREKPNLSSSEKVLHKNTADKNKDKTVTDKKKIKIKSEKAGKISETKGVFNSIGLKKSEGITNKSEGNTHKTKSSTEGIQDFNIQNGQENIEKLENIKSNVDTESFLQNEHIRPEQDKISSAAVSKKRYSDILSLKREIKLSALDDNDKNSILTDIQNLLEQTGKKELDYIISHIPQNDTRDRYKRIKNRIKTFEDIDTKEYEDIIDSYIDKAEQKEIQAMVSRADKKDRKSLLELMEHINSMGFEMKNSEPYIKEIKDRITEIDNEKVLEICPDINNLTVEEGLKAIEEIAKADILPEIKSNMLELIDKKLTRMKTEENIQLIEKFDKSLTGRLSDTSRIHFYDARKMQSGDSKDPESLIIRRALSSYAVLIGKYEYPIAVFDSSIRRNGKEGFILTPDHIFYKGFLKSGCIDVKNIESVCTDEKQKGKGIFVEHNSQKRIKLPSVFNNADEKNLVDVLDKFIEYLGVKPESRSVSYMSQLSHSSVCCYRCGHVFKDGNICPKCGSKN